MSNNNQNYLKIGFNNIDSKGRFMDAMKGVSPEGKSSFNEAYVFGIGQMLKFNEVYLANRRKTTLRPNYMHLVIGADADQEGKVSFDEMVVM